MSFLQIKLNYSWIYLIIQRDLGLVYGACLKIDFDNNFKEIIHPK